MHGLRDAGAAFDRKVLDVMNVLGVSLGKFSICLGYRKVLDTLVRLVRWGDDFSLSGRRSNCNAFRGELGGSTLLVFRSSILLCRVVQVLRCCCGEDLGAPTVAVRSAVFGSHSFGVRLQSTGFWTFLGDDIRKRFRIQRLLVQHFVHVYVSLRRLLRKIHIFSMSRWTYSGIFVFTAPVAEPTVVSFTVPLNGCTIVATAFVVTLCSRRQIALAPQPQCASEVFASRCRVVVVLFLVVLTILFGTV